MAAVVVYLSAASWSLVKKNPDNSLDFFLLVHGYSHPYFLRQALLMPCNFMGVLTLSNY
jgi:hypothetical protein